MKVAFISGAGEGIGLAIAHAFALAGYSVAVNDVDASRAQAAAQEIIAVGGSALALAGDVADVARVRAMVAETTAYFGRLDAAVANAGITSWGEFLDYEPLTFDRVMGVNLRGSYFTAQAAARQMRDQGTGGRIIFTASVAGHQAIRFLSAYAMSKAALEMLARNLVVELSPYKITVNTVAPGPTLTPRNLADDPDYAAKWSSVMPNGQVGTPEDIASTVLFLCSDAARQITGQSIVVDGGWTAVSPTPGLDFVEQQKH